MCHSWLGWQIDTAFKQLFCPSHPPSSLSSFMLSCPVFWTYNSRDSKLPIDTDPYIATDESHLLYPWPARQSFSSKQDKLHLRRSTLPLFYYESYNNHGNLQTARSIENDSSADLFSERVTRASDTWTLTVRSDIGTQTSATPSCTEACRIWGHGKTGPAGASGASFPLQIH